ncbi:MAG: hypothetical protein JNK23_07750 [Opitutaceae bacterium]|nr:hypothetical protein [Opitutaceae bacterium]
MTPETFWDLPETERLAYARASMMKFIQELPVILTLAAKRVQLRPDPETDHDANRILAWLNTELRNHVRFRRRHVLASHSYWDWESVREDLRSTSALYPCHIQENVEALIAFLESSNYTLDGALDTILSLVANGDLDWRGHKEKLRVVFPHISDIVGVTGKTLHAMWASPHRLELFSLLCSASRRVEFAEAPFGGVFGGVDPILDDSINHERCPYSWRSFVLALALMFILQGLNNGIVGHAMQASTLNQKWGLEDVFTDDWEDTYHDREKLFFPFLARVPKRDKVHVEGVILAHWLAFFELNAERYDSGVPYFSDCRAIRNQRAWNELTGSKFFAERFAFLISYPTRLPGEWWRECVESGLVNVDAAKKDGPREMLKALEYSPEELNTVFFREQVFWD